jgi:hypothetical protein
LEAGVLMVPAFSDAYTGLGLPSKLYRIYISFCSR